MSKVALIVGQREPTVGTGYYASTDELIMECWDAAMMTGTLYTNSPDCVRAFCVLHRHGIFKLELYTPEGRKIEVDAKGEFIQPWTDDFFDNGFNCLFHYQNIEELPTGAAESSQS